MRRHKILTRTLLILSTINFALTAPAAVRGRPEVYLDANVIWDVTATSQKRGDSSDEGGSRNVPDLNYAPPPSPDLTDILSQIAPSDSRHNPPPSWEPLDWGGSPNVPGLGHAPPPSPDLTDILSQTAHGNSPPPPSPPPPDSPGSLTGPDYVPPSPGFPTGSRLSVGSMPVAGSLSPPPPPFPHPSQPGPSEDHFPPGFGPLRVSANPDTLSLIGSTGNQPTLPQSPGVDPEIHSLLNSETFPTEFWDKFLKGKIKRRISGSDAVNLAQKDPRSQIF